MTISGPNIDSRLFESLRELIETVMVDQRLRFAGVFGYTIQGVHGESPNVTIDAVPNNDLLGLPSISNAPMNPSISGITSVPPTGIGCLVAFIDRDPTKPTIVGVDSLGQIPIVRQGDQVTMFLPQSLLIQGQANLVPGGSGTVTGVITIANPITGIVSAGSAEVFTG